MVERFPDEALHYQPTPNGQPRSDSILDEDDHDGGIGLEIDFLSNNADDSGVALRSLEDLPWETVLTKFMLPEVDREVRAGLIDVSESHPHINTHLNVLAQRMKSAALKAAILEVRQKIGDLEKVPASYLQSIVEITAHKAQILLGRLVDILQKKPHRESHLVA